MYQYCPAPNSRGLIVGEGGAYIASPNVNQRWRRGDQLRNGTAGDGGAIRGEGGVGRPYIAEARNRAALATVGGIVGILVAAITRGEQCGIVRESGTGDVHVVGCGDSATATNARKVGNRLVCREDALGNGHHAKRGDRAALVMGRVVVEGAVIDHDGNSACNSAAALLGVVRVEVRIVNGQRACSGHGAALSVIVIATHEGDAGNSQVASGGKEWCVSESHHKRGRRTGPHNAQVWLFDQVDIRHRIDARAEVNGGTGRRIIDRRFDRTFGVADIEVARIGA